LHRINNLAATNGVAVATPPNATQNSQAIRPVELQLHPITLGFQPRAARILAVMTTRSKAFGANVTVKAGVGSVVPTP